MAVPARRKLPKYPKVKDSAPKSQGVPTYSLFENAIKTLYEQGKVSTPNSVYRDINSTGLAPKRLEYQLAGFDEKIAEWKEKYGENMPIPRDELLQFATDYNAKKTIRSRVQRPDPRDRANKVTSVDQPKYSEGPMTLTGEPVTEQELWDEWDERRQERLSETLNDIDEGFNDTNSEYGKYQQSYIDRQRASGQPDEPWMERFDKQNKLYTSTPEMEEQIQAWRELFPDEYYNDEDFKYPEHPDPTVNDFIYNGLNNDDFEPGSKEFIRQNTPKPSRHPDGSLMTEEEIRDIRRSQGINDPYAKPMGAWEDALQAPIKKDPTSDLGSPQTARKQARWQDYTFDEMRQIKASVANDEALSDAFFANIQQPDGTYRKTSGTPDDPELETILDNSGRGKQRLAELQQHYAYNQGVSTPSMDQELAKLKLILGDNISMTPVGTNYKEYLFNSKPRVPYDDVPVEQLAEQGKLGPAAMDKDVLLKLLGYKADHSLLSAVYDGYSKSGFRIGEQPYRAGLGWEKDSDAGTKWNPLFPYTMPHSPHHTLAQSPKLVKTNTFLDETDPHDVPHYRTTDIAPDSEVQGDTGYLELHNMQGPSQNTRKGNLAKAKPKDLIPSMAFNIDDDVQRVPRLDFLRNLLGTDRKALIPTGNSVNTAEGIPIRAGNEEYGTIGNTEPPRLIRAFMNDLSKEGVPQHEMSYGPATGRYADTHNVFTVSDAARELIRKNGIRALGLGAAATMAGALDKEQTNPYGY